MRRMPPPDCEYTAPGSETEAIDCWAVATRRHVDSNGHTLGVFCAQHADAGAFHIDKVYRQRYGKKARAGDVTIELIESDASSTTV